MNAYQELENMKKKLQSYINELTNYDGNIAPQKVTGRLNGILRGA